jgi:hypothetical protein
MDQVPVQKSGSRSERVWFVAYDGAAIFTTLTLALFFVQPWRFPEMWAAAQDAFAKDSRRADGLMRIACICPSTSH